MMQVLRAVFLLSMLLLLGSFARARAEDNDEPPKIRIESRSPNGRYAFRYLPETAEDPQRYQLIRRSPHKVLATVLESDVDPGPSARFSLEPLWRRDSGAVALTAQLWKRGTFVEVYVRNGTGFRAVKLPDLEAPIPDRLKGGGVYPRIVALNSQTAVRWQRNGSLVVKIENIRDGGEGTVKATRTVVLSFSRTGKAHIVYSRTRYEKSDE